MATEVVIVGGGLAGGRVAESYRESGGTGNVVLVAAESHPPYHRPPLTKRLLRGEAEAEDTLLAPAEHWGELGIDLRLGTTATALDLERRELQLDDGGRLPFANLVIATGAAPRRLPIPGADLEGVHALRTLDDALSLRAAAENAQRAVAIGTGFIGLETAASLRARGLQVTIVDMAAAPFHALGAPEFSAYLVQLYREHGVPMLLQDGIAAFRGGERVESVQTSSGRELRADLVVVGVGVAPSTGWLEDSKLEIDNGVVVDARFRTGVEGVYAVGDVANFQDPVFGRRRRIEHWSNADYQGRLVGAALAGNDAEYDRVSTFFTEMFGNAFKFFGDSTGATDVVTDGSFADGRAIVSYRDGDALRAVLAAGLSSDEEAELQTTIRRDAQQVGVAA
jgi:3-phenylpropionate/trans-cinnamate dioxygenase ferredoxin reductase subunit